MTIPWKAYFPVWWGFFWRVTVYSIVLAIILGIVLGVVGVTMGRAEEVAVWATWLGWPLSIFVSLSALKESLEKQLPRLIAATQSRGLDA